MSTNTSMDPRAYPPGRHTQRDWMEGSSCHRSRILSGEVVDAGRQVTRVKIGDRVAVNAVDSCRNCSYCRQGAYALCLSAAYIGFARDGGFAEFAVVPQDCCYPLSQEVSYAAGALVEPLAVGATRRQASSTYDG